MIEPLIAESFPELCYLVMRETPNQSYFTAVRIIERARELGIRLRMESGYAEGSRDWIENIHGAMKRESGENNRNNEGKNCLFSPENSSCTEPWGLSSQPIEGETYLEFRRRVRGGHSSKQSAKRKESQEPFYATPPTKVYMKSEPFAVLGPEDGDGIHYICFFEKVVEYRNEFNVTHREGNLPAVFDFSKTSERMIFCVAGSEHRLDGPAIIYPDRSLDEFYVRGEQCGDVTDDDCHLKYAILVKRHSNGPIEQEKMSRIQSGTYHGYDEYIDEMQRAMKLYRNFLLDEATGT